MNTISKTHHKNVQFHEKKDQRNQLPNQLELQIHIGSRASTARTARTVIAKRVPTGKSSPFPLLSHPSRPNTSLSRPFTAHSLRSRPETAWIGSEVGDPTDHRLQQEMERLIFRQKQIERASGVRRATPYPSIALDHPIKQIPLETLLAPSPCTEVNVTPHPPTLPRPSVHRDKSANHVGQGNATRGKVFLIMNGQIRYDETAFADFLGRVDHVPWPLVLHVILWIETISANYSGIMM
jgi:hypothetical protein